MVASAVALAFSAWPALRPDPRELIAAKLRVEAVEPAVTFGDYLRRTGYRVKGARASDLLRARGYVVYLQTKIEGRKHGDLLLNQVLYRASTGRRIPDQGPTQDAYFRADTPNDQWINQVFVPDPPYDFAVFVRLEMFDGKALLAFADTRPLGPPKSL